MSSSDAPRFDVLEQLQQLLLSSGDVVDFLGELASLSALVLPERELSVGITMRWDRQALTVASSDERAERLDETQYQSHQGPCLQSMQTGEIVLSNDLGTEERWPDYTAMARTEGLRCSLSLPLTDELRTVGAVNIYGFETPNLFGQTEQRLYTLFVAQAAGALRMATRRATDTALIQQFEEALASRSVIDQAIGILIGRHNVTGAQAFDLLRQQSQATHRKLRDIATDFVTDATGQPTTFGQPFDTDDTDA